MIPDNRVPLGKYIINIANNCVKMNLNSSLILVFKTKIKVTSFPRKLFWKRVSFVSMSSLYSCGQSLNVLSGQA